MKNTSLLNKLFPKAILVFIFIFICFSNEAQILVSVSGKAYDKENRNLPLARLMIINKRTNNGVFADADGRFSLSIQQTDTLIFSAIGFRVKKICLKDSLSKKQYTIEVALQKLSYDLQVVSVFADRTLDDIQKDINKLGNTNTYSVTGVNAIESPITALYERFSKFGKAKQKVAEWENEDLKRDILKDLFRLYVKYDVIDLNDDEFDDFIKYLNLSDDFIQKASQFELTMAIKGRYESYKYRWK
jgi:hypothetical protein